MIKSFRHKGVEAYFKSGSISGIRPTHAARLALLLTALNSATRPEDMNARGWKLHKLSGRNPKGQPVGGHWSVMISANWRLTFYFEGADAILVDYHDYH